MRVGIFFLYFTLVVISLNHCDADRSMKLLRGPKLGRNIISKNPKKLKMTKHFNLPSLFSTNEQTYSISSPLSMTPYESLPPNSLPENNPPYCDNPPPSTPTTIPTPTGSQPSTPSSIFPTQSPPPSPITIIPGPPGSSSTPTPDIDVSPPSTITPGSPNPVLNPPIVEPGPPGSSLTPTPDIDVSPPSTITPGSPNPVLNPPIVEPGPPETTMTPPYFEPSPPFYIPSPTGGIIPGPPITFPSPTGGGIVPSPTVFQPPIIYPPPSVPPPRNAAPSTALWCVAKPSVPDPIIQEAMNYACDSGAECDSISTNGPCFEPNSVYAHASYAFNSYWQKSKAAGGTCDFGGTAILVSVDPSFDGCRFIYS